MSEFNNENQPAFDRSPIRDSPSEDRSSYQTAPLAAYNSEYRQVAEELFNRIAAGFTSQAIQGKLQYFRKALAGNYRQGRDL